MTQSTIQLIMTSTDIAADRLAMANTQLTRDIAALRNNMSEDELDHARKVQDKLLRIRNLLAEIQMIVC